VLECGLEEPSRTFLALRPFFFLPFHRHRRGEEEEEEEEKKEEEEEEEEEQEQEHAGHDPSPLG
jgi:hypothetical protein